jgi:phosphatidylglycerol:prolipoprotein diacylglycerol transferase
MPIPTYTALLLLGIAISLGYWLRQSHGNRHLFPIYLGALGGAFLGAKIVFLLAEGWVYWNDPHRWLQWATGKTILGALLGGYAGVEYAKARVGHTTATGDTFAAIAPFTIMLGRLGCLQHGCCVGIVCTRSWLTLDDFRGIARWPAVPMEILFNLIALLTFAIFRARNILLGQHFHLYLITYGLFRFLHEFARDTVRIYGPFTVYQIPALAVAALGLIRYLQRRKSLSRNGPPAAAFTLHWGSLRS